MSEIEKFSLSQMVKKLQLWAPLSSEDQDAILALPCTVRSLAAAQYIVWDGNRQQHSCLLVEGFAFRHRVIGDGSRQIFSSTWIMSVGAVSADHFEHAD